MDVANLTAEDVDWSDQSICYQREKLKNLESRQIKPPLIRFGEQVVSVLRSLPQAGPLFPRLREVQSKDRANEFRQRCQGLGIKGVSLHSYRYARAERALQCGYPERFAQQALGHNSKAVHHAYSKHAEVTMPSLDDWEKQWKKDPHGMKQPKVVAVDFQSSLGAPASAAAEGPVAALARTEAQTA